MGFIKAVAGAVGGTLADQWVDFLVPPEGLAPTAAIFPAVHKGTNAGRGSNVKASENIITHGSKIVVPEGYGLVTFHDGQITGLITDPGGYEYSTDDTQGQSIFTEGGFVSALVKSSWERFKYGGQPPAQHLAFYVNLKEIPNNRFGTQSEIYWDDAFLGTQVGAVTRGTYTIKIVDPVLFVKQFVPYAYYSADAKIFDFTDLDNDAASQLFNEVVGSLAPAFSIYTNDPEKGNRMARIQSDSLGFAQSLSQAVENGYQWESQRGLVIVSTAIQSIEYDEVTRKLLADVQKADALSGSRGGAFLQQSVARGFEAAGEGGGGNMAMMGMGLGMTGQAMNFQQQGQQQAPYQNPFQQGQQQPQGQQQQAQQPPAQQPPATTEAPAAAEDPVAKLAQFKQMLDQGLISQEDFDAAKQRVLGL
ncbi:MAG TPA: SPFH domain-containing protein [Microbacteriaceae bacterium]|nr:SPFH domain-containing protein [Microbacteriaceae bacterium]